ncbi:hypothetical protein B0J11DRAFT_66163 [Dendryphion nanum]|uniref:Uncharacterized protein n=1 Tax=Dendryphion nanum TaxID=256645 RepID=A0A9P9IF90_9PLEO|nr:hypothetical protein B0J11DRAFT_66163 [Dendryphion nanum]
MQHHRQTFSQDSSFSLKGSDVPGLAVSLSLSLSLSLSCASPSSPATPTRYCTINWYTTEDGQPTKRKQTLFLFSQNKKKTQSQPPLALARNHRHATPKNVTAISKPCKGAKAAVVHRLHPEYPAWSRRFKLAPSVERSVVLWKAKTRESERRRAFGCNVRARRPASVYAGLT